MYSRKRRFPAFCVTFGLCLSLAAIPGYAEDLGGVQILTGVWRGETVEYLAGEILVGLKAGETQQRLSSELGLLPVDVVRDADATGFLKLQAEAGQDLFELIDQVVRLPSVRYAEPNMVDRTHIIPDDEYFINQWHYHNTGQVPPGGTPDADIDAPEGWDINTGSSTIRVGVLDTGIPIQGGSLSHPDLDDTSRYLFGYDFANNDAVPADDNGHGTHVSGTIAAETNNSIGVAGVSWHAQIMAIKVFNAYGSGSHENFRDGCFYATDSGCHVINYSGGGSASATKEWGVAYADTHGVVVCAAAGNSYGGSVIWPAAYSLQYSNCIAVSATDHNDSFSPYSSKGPEVTVSAPGGRGSPFNADDVYSTMPNYQVYLNTAYGLPLNYAYLAGTSMATPHVAGLAALILSLNSTLAPDSVREIMKNTADDLGVPGRDDYFGWGRINVRNAQARPSVVATSPAQNELNVPVSTNVAVTFDVDMDETTINSSTFIVNARSTGLHQGTFSYDSSTRTATLDPDDDFEEGEIVTVSLTEDIRSSGGVALGAGYVWSFTTDVYDLSPGTFVADAAYVVGDKPISVFAGDFDGDGDLDIAAASITSDSVSVLLNNGDGTYASQSTYPAGGGQRSVYGGDLDGDGDVDLAIAIYSNSSISVVLNNGDGTFGSYSSYQAQYHPYSVYAADLDGDGDLDLAAANFAVNGSVSVLLNNGDGTFAARADYAVGSAPLSVFAADVDGDADLDLAVANRSSNSVSVLLNNGDGSFSPHTEYPVGNFPFSVFAADLDGDGAVDLAAANQTSDDVSVLLNNGDGTFTSHSVSEVGDGPRAVFAADFDGDGDLDLATANFYSTDVSVLANNGDATFAGQLVYQVGDSLWEVFAADLDGDSDIDLVSADTDAGQVTVLLNETIVPHVVATSPLQNELNVPVGTDITATFDFYMDPMSITGSTFRVYGRSTGLHDGTISYYEPTRTATFDPDDDFDGGEVVTIVLTTGVQSVMGVPLDNGFAWSFTTEVDEESPGTFYADSTYAVGDKPISVFAADFDGDGDLDLSVPSITSDYVSILLGNGDATFAAQSTYYAGGGQRSCYAGDVDADGDLDLAIAIYHASSIAVLLNNGNGTFGSPSLYAIEYHPYSVCAADFNGDGFLDLANADFLSNGSVSVILNNGDGTYGIHTAYPVASTPISVFAADLDGDGDIDLSSANRGGNSVSVLLNKGDGTFATHSAYQVGSGPRSVFGADLDGDGDVDLIAANRGSNSLSVLLNSGTGTFAGQVAYAVDSEPRAVFAADFDGDGDQDLVSGNWGANNVSVLFNNGDGTFAAHVVYSVGADPWGIFGADLDGDGDVDLVTPDNGADQVSVLLNRPLAVPEAPDLVSPYNGVFTTDHTPTLNWTDVATATSYETVVDDDYYFGSIDRSQSGLTVSQWTVSPSLGDDTWYWKARAHNEAGAGPWSEIWHFTTYTYLPSCPVLFSFDGHAYQEENTILTACEKSAYVDVVTDYYRVTGPVAPQNGTVRFQIREMEDETTYLHDLELIVVDHADNTKVACSVDGIIDTYKETLAPLSAVDHNGIDRLAELIETDGNRFTSEESGYLIVTFPYADHQAAAFEMETEIKPRPCAVKGSGIADNSPERPIPGGELRVHILDSDGFWVPLPAMPSRDQAADEIVFTDLTKRIDTDVIVVRLSWENGYSTDAVGQLISAEETPVVRTYRVDAFAVERATPAAKTFSGFAEGDPLVLRNGDLLEVSFAVGPPVESDMARDYIIRAVGRYQPDYAVYPQLLPKQFQLHRNYPNPFNPQTIVSYDIPVAAHVKLEIYNVLGQRVTILVDEAQQAGRYQVEWNSRDHSGSPVASGVYFYRLTADDFVQSRKMVLLR